MKEIIFYLLMFCIGTLFGSFFTLAVYRIPLHQDITHKRSYCPNCNHKLSFFDMIPILSYIFLGGRCRYCKNKIRPRYLILEILTGIVFLLFAMSVNISFNLNSILYLSIGILYLAGIIIIAGIDKEQRKIENAILLYEVLIAALYMVYLYVVAKTNIYKYAIYLVCLVILLIINNVYFKKKLKNSYPIDILELSVIMIIFSTEITYVSTVIITLLSIIIGAIENFIIKATNKASKTNKSYYKDLPIGFYLVCANIISIILINFIKM